MVRSKAWSNQQKDNPSPDPNNGAGLSSVVTRNIIDHALDRMVIGFIIDFGTYFNKVEVIMTNKEIAE